VSANLDVVLAAQVQVHLPFVRVEAIPAGHDWPGLPLVAVLDGTSAVIASRDGAGVLGHWSSAPPFVAAARITFDRLRMTP
jgi:hypothetical protein